MVNYTQRPGPCVINFANWMIRIDQIQCVHRHGVDLHIDFADRERGTVITCESAMQADALFNSISDAMVKWIRGELETK